MIIDQLFTSPLFEDTASPRIAGLQQTQHDDGSKTTDYAVGPLQSTQKVDAQGRPLKTTVNYDMGIGKVGREQDHVSGIRTTTATPAEPGADPNALLPTSSIAAARGVDPKKFAAFRTQQGLPLNEFAPSGDDGEGPDQEEILRRLAAHWWNGNEHQMARAEHTLAAMGWEIGEDDGYDDGGVFVVRPGDEHGRSYLSWPHEELDMNEAAPPGAKAERMVKHIKQGYAKDGKLTPKEKGIAFATAWKAHNAGQVEEGEYQDDYEDEETELCNGCYVRDKEDSSGEIFVMRGDPGDRRVRIEDQHGRGWNIAPYRLTVVDDSDPDIAAYFGDELDEAGVTEAAQGHTIEAHGVRGMDRRTWHKTFRNTDQMIAWAEKHDAEIIGTRDLEQARHHNLSPAKAKGVAEGSEQKPAITYKDYTLQYDYQTEDDDPEGYSTATTYYFDVLKDGDRVGEAEYFDYFGNLTIRINGKTKEFGFRHPLASQISQLVSSLPDEQKKDLSDPRFESQDLTEVFADQGSGSTDRDNADYMKRRRAAKKAGSSVTKKPQPYNDPDWTKKLSKEKLDAIAGPRYNKDKKDVTEMDKSEPGAGRDTGPRSGPDKEAKPITAKKATKDAGDMLNRAVKDSRKKKDVKESDTLMLKLKRAMVQEGRVKELADDLKTMNDADFMKKYGKAKAAIRKDMKRIDEKLTTSDPFAFPAAKASSGKAIDDTDVMGSLKSASTPKFDRFSKTGGETEVETDPTLVAEPNKYMQAWGGKYATGSTGEDNRFTAPAGWRYVEKDEDPARYGSAPAVGSGLPDLKYDPQSRSLKPADAPALDMSPKDKYKFDRQTLSMKPADGSGAPANIDAATRDRARAWAAQQNAPAAALAGAMRSSGNPVDTAKKKVDWKTIYDLNKAIIGTNPNLIKPGMKLKMPDGSTYPVQSGDTLAKIAANQSQIMSEAPKSAAVRLGNAIQRVQGRTAASQARSIIPSSIPKPEPKKDEKDAKKVDESRAARRALMAQIVNGN